MLDLFGCTCFGFCPSERFPKTKTRPISVDSFIDAWKFADKCVFHCGGQKNNNSKLHFDFIICHFFSSSKFLQRGDSTVQQRKDKVYPALCSFCTQPHNTVWGALLCEVKCSVSNMTQQVFSVLLYQINIPLFPQTALSILAVTLNCVSNEQLCFFKPDGITGLSRAAALWFPAFGSEFSMIAINLRTVSGDVNNRKIQKSTRAPLRRLQRLYIK